MNHKELGFSTRAIHAGQQKDQYGALSTPIYQSSTFSFANCRQGGNRFAGEESGFIYTRLGNPTTKTLEDRVSSLEGAEDTVAFSSGMGAITSVVWSICKAGSHIIADKILYGCTFSFFEHGLTRYGVEVDFIDMSNLDELRAALKKNTAMIYMETPVNPTLKIADLEMISKIAHDYNPEIMTVVDNTFATPYLQKPLALGCDVSLHSATKYLNGHGDVIAGLACGKADFMEKVRLFGLKDMTGSVIGPFEAYLILRGLKTLDVRMERHLSNTDKIVEFLKSHPKIEKIYYPGLENHPNHDVAMKQMKHPGAMLAFEVKGGKAAGEKMLDSLELCTLAVSLGDAETLIEHPASMTHSTYTPEELVAVGIPESLIRLSVGLENWEDIVADLKQGLDKI